MDSDQISLPILDAAAPPAIDPVCGMKVNVSSAKHTFDYNGEMYYFCGRSCVEKFSANPTAFLTRSKPGPNYAGDKPQRPAEISSDAFYTCPMHPEIRQRGLLGSRTSASRQAAARPRAFKLPCPSRQALG